MSEINAKPRDKFESTHKRLSQSIIYTPPETNAVAKLYGCRNSCMLGGDNFRQIKMSKTIATCYLQCK